MSELEDKIVKPTIDLEKVFFEIFTELKLKPAQCQLIRAFLILSNGKNEFEASFTEFTKRRDMTKKDITMLVMP